MHGKAITEATENDIYQTLAYLVRETVTTDWLRTKETYIHKKSKQVYYFSLEFLLGRFLHNNLLSLDVLKDVERGLDELGYQLSDLTEEEPEPGLGERRGSVVSRRVSSIPWLRWVCLDTGTGSGISTVCLSKKSLMVIKSSYRITG